MELPDFPLHDLRISHDFINNLEPVEFSGNIQIIDKEGMLESVFKRIKYVAKVGFDTESRPSFFKGQHYPVSIIQVSLENEAFIFKLKNLGLCGKIKDFLSDPSIIKIGVGLIDDMKRLQDMSFFKPAGFVDLAEIARSKGIIQTGARALTARYLGRKLIKSSQKTNWARANLTEKQLRYAATDAWVCLKIINRLKEDNTDYIAMKEAEEAEKAAEAGTDNNS